jgi:hypothetical protein
MTDTTTVEKKAREGRSPEFPYVDLKTAVELAEKFRVAEGKHVVPSDSAKKAWGMGLKSGGARRTVAALGHFGLFAYEGEKDDKKVRLSEAALRILLDKQPESPERDELIRRAALTPSIHKEMWEKWGADLPSDATIETFLVRDRGFSGVGAGDLMTEYKNTLAYAKLGEGTKMPAPGPDEQAAEGAGDGADHLPPPPPPPPTPAQGKVPLMQSERVVFTEENSPQTYVKLIASGDVDDTLLEALEDYVKRQRKRLEKKEAAN